MEILIYGCMVIFAIIIWLFSYYKQSYVLSVMAACFFAIIGITILSSPIVYYSGVNTTNTYDLHQNTLSATHILTNGTVSTKEYKLYTPMNTNVSNFWGIMMLIITINITIFNIYDIIGERKSNNEEL